MAIIVNQIKNHLETNYPSELPLETRKIAVKEYLQAYILNFLYNHPKYSNLNFYGGTCARIIYNLNRMSEDIDLDNSAHIDVSNLAQELETYFRSSLLLERTSIHTQTGLMGIMRLTVKLPILHQLDLSPYEDEKLHIKVELSDHQQIAHTVRTYTNLYGQGFIAQHFDLPSLMAGKMIACLERHFRKGNTDVVVKGRDFYDLIWYMQQKVEPLSEKLLSDGKESYTVKKAISLLEEKITHITPNDLAVDLAPLFPQQHFAQNFIKHWTENFHELFTQLAKHYK